MEWLTELMRWFTENWDGDTGYLVRTWEHIQVSGFSVLIATAIAVPLGAWLGHTGKGGLAVVSVVNIGRALPSFGILALALPFTIRIARNVPFIDSGLGFFPTSVALVALALPPIFTNTYTGVRGVDREVVEAARGMGITERRLLLEVEMPIASPVIITGMRVTSVQVVATATLGALVGFGGLGRYIIDGLATQNSTMLLAGALLVAALSVVTEVAFSIAERFIVPRAIQGREAKVTQIAPPAPA